MVGQRQNWRMFDGQAAGRAQGGGEVMPVLVQIGLGLAIGLPLGVAAGYFLFWYGKPLPEAKQTEHLADGVEDSGESAGVRSTR